MVQISKENTKDDFKALRDQIKFSFRDPLQQASLITLINFMEIMLFDTLNGEEVEIV